MNFPRARRQIRKVQKGFTLIELMIVVAIIGILAAVAIPQYRDYTTKARWSANVAAVAGLQQAVAQCLQENAGAIAACDTMAELVSTGVLRSADVPSMPGGAGVAVYDGQNGAIKITGNDKAGTCVITLTPDGANSQTANSLTWKITVGTKDGCSKQSTGFEVG